MFNAVCITIFKLHFFAGGQDIFSSSRQDKNAVTMKSRFDSSLFGLLFIKTEKKKGID